jgi:hypothetical protein
MRRFHACNITIILILCMLMAAAGVAKKLTATAVPVPASVARSLVPPGAASALRLAPGDTCTTMDGKPIYYIYPWVYGDEIYKAYQDPAHDCQSPYPYTVDAIGIYLIFLDAGSIYLSADVEGIDSTTPGCPKPGAVKTISSLYEVPLDTAQGYLWRITIPLDTPVDVNGPFFAGIYISPDGLPQSAAIITDSFPARCRSYNDWGEGYVDLDTVHNTSNEKVFPGKMLIYSIGLLGGNGGTPPAPVARFIQPLSNDLVGPTVDLWAGDASGSKIIKSARFDYYGSGVWHLIGTDNLNDPALRNGVAAAGTGRGLSYTWSTSSMTEGDYQIRTIVTDTLNRSDTATITVQVDPTPPLPVITQPTRGQNVCGGATVTAFCTDEDLSYVSFDVKSIAKDFQLGLPIISQQYGGDANGHPTDNNLVSAGEFGDYCSGPAAAAMAVKYWYNQGYSDIMIEGNLTVLNDYQLIDRLYAAMHVRANLGTYDPDFVGGLRDYIVAHSGHLFTVRANRSPKIADLINLTGDYGNVVMLGVSGTPGFWMTTAGMNPIIDQSGQYSFTLANPMSGTAATYKIREDAGGMYVYHNSAWKKIDIIVGMVANEYDPQRTPAGADFNGADGWGLSWNTSSLSENMYHFMHVTAIDQSDRSGSAAVLVQNSCTFAGKHGDLNNDGAIDLADLVYMLAFLYQNGIVPPAGHAAGDVNCDGNVNIVDIMYLCRYLYQGGSAPCP